MEIVTYLQARAVISPDLTEAQASRVLTITGRAQEWLEKVAQLVQKNPAASDIEMVELSGMGKAILQNVPRAEWVYLINPSLAPSESVVAQEQIVRDGKLFSMALSQWLLAQEMGTIYRLSHKDFTPEEAKVMRLLWQKQESIVEREEIAVALWGESWSTKYSDWGIDALMSRLRRKLSGRSQLMTIKSRGYMLVATVKPTQAPQHAMNREKLAREIPASIYPSDEYLRYMNDPQRVRKVYKDLFATMQREKIVVSSRAKSRDPSTTVGMTKIILCVNSYSYDNVDAIVTFVKAQKWEGVKVYFSHYDPRAIEMHQARIRELGVDSWVEAWHDDLRESKLGDASIDLLINDFRLNFNQNDAQNRQMMGHTARILKPDGVALISTVVDGRYENVRYGVDQEKAPINAGKPGLFQADEHLVRRCWSVPYWRQLWSKTGFREVQEFDIEEGKRWGGGEVTLTVDPWKGPYFRRWILKK